LFKREGLKTCHGEKGGKNGGFAGAAAAYHALGLNGKGWRERKKVGGEILKGPGPPSQQTKKTNGGSGGPGDGNEEKEGSDEG